MPTVRAASVLIAAAFLLGACGNTTPTPAPATSVPASSMAAEATSAPATTPAPTAAPPAAATSAPTPEPSAAPLDASNAFVQTMSQLRAKSVIDGSATAGSAGSKISGALTVSGQSSDHEQTTTTGRARATVHVIVAGGARYTTAYDLWFDAGAPSADSLPALLTGIDGGVTDLGMETKTGQELHHLSITPPANAAAAIGVPAKGSSEVAVTMDAWVQEDGTPVFMTLGAAWAQAAGKKTVDAIRTLELAFSDVGSAITVAAPTQTWKMNHSTVYKYRVAYPSDWLFDKGRKKAKRFWPDAYWGYDTDAVFIGAASSGGTNLGWLNSHFKKFMSLVWEAKSVSVSSNKPARMGSLGARKVEVTYKIGKNKYYAEMYLTVKGGKFYYIEYRSEKKLTDDDKATAAGFARSFSLK